MIQIFIVFTALFTSVLTFFSGFGLGTILLPAMAIFYPLPVAIVLTGIVHFINGTVKVFILRNSVNLQVLIKFGFLAIPFAFLGALLLTKLEQQHELFTYTLLDKQLGVAPLNLVVGILMIGFTLLEIIPKFKNFSFDKKYLPLGGVVSGFFGGLTGHQGAFRSMFLIRANLTKEQFVATGAAFSFFVDLTRLTVYFKNISTLNIQESAPFLFWVISAAVLGAVIGDRLLRKVDIKFIKYFVSASIFILGVLIAGGVV